MRLLNALLIFSLVLSPAFADNKAVPAIPVDPSDQPARALPVEPPAPSDKVHPRSHHGPQILTLKECLAKVLVQDPSILAINFDLDSLDRRAQAIRASYLPQFVGVGETGYIAGSSTNAFSVIGAQEPSVGKSINSSRVVITPHSTDDLLSDINVTSLASQRQLLGLNAYRQGGGKITMPLINSGSFLGINTPPAATEKYAEKEAAKYGGELTTQQIIYAVTNAYLSVVVAEHKLKLLGREQLLDGKLLEVARAQFKYGINTEFDVTSAETTYAESQQAYAVNAGMAVQAFLQLSLMLGVDNPSSFAVATDFPAMPTLPSYQMLLAMVGDHQPSVLQQEAVVKEAQAQLTFDQDRIWPTVNYEGDYSYGDDYQHKGNTMWNTFVTINVPIFDFGVLSDTAKADLDTLKADQLRVKAAQEQLIQDLYTTIGSIRDNTTALAGINGQVDTAAKEQAKTLVLTKVDAITLISAINNEEDYIRLRLTQEDQILHDMLSYAQLQMVLAGKWNWLDNPSKINPTSAIPVD